MSQATKWNLVPGLNHVGAYQVSGQPYVSGNINCRGAYEGGFEVKFPYVTRWFQVTNKAVNNDLRVGFSSFGIVGKNYYTVPRAETNDNGPTHSTGILELKVSSVFISGSLDVDIIAGLTKIPTGSTTTSIGPNWSGSAGVG